MASGDYYLGRNGAQEGPFSPNEVKRRLAAGEISPNDACWRDGMAGWVPIRDVPELAWAPPPIAPGASGPNAGAVPPPLAEESFSQSMMRQAATTVQLAQKQAYHKKLELTDLRSAWHAIGQKAYQLRAVPAAHAARVTLLDEVTQQIAELQAQAAPASSGSISDSAKVIAATASKAAKVQSLRMKESGLYTELGEKIAGDPNPPPALAAEVGAARKIRDEMAGLEAEIKALSSKTPIWARQPLLIAGAVVVLIVVAVIFTHWRTPEQQAEYDAQQQVKKFQQQEQEQEDKARQQQLALQAEQEKEAAAAQAAAQAAQKKQQADYQAQRQKQQQEIEAQQQQQQALAAAQQKQQADAEAAQEKAQADEVAKQKAAADAAAAARMPGALWPGLKNIADFATAHEGDLWNVAQDKLVAQKWGPYAIQGPVLDSTTFMFGHDTRGPEWGFAEPYSTIYDPSHPDHYYRMDGLPPGAKLAADHRRLIYVEKGDFWRAEWDWANSTVVNRKQVTTSGVFDGKEALLWYGNTILVKGGFSADKPIVKIDLAALTTEEISPANAIVDGMEVNPGGYLIYHSSGNIISTYDLRNGEARTLSNACHISDGTHWKAGAILSNESSAPIWLTNDVAAMTLSPEGWSAVALFNIKTGKQTVFKAHAAWLHLSLKLPDNTTLVVGLGEKGPDGENAILLDTTTGTETPLPFAIEQPSVWLDGEHCLYGKTTGGLDEIGTWLYDRKTGQSTRIATRTINAVEPVAFLADGTSFYFSVQNGDTVLRGKLDGSQAVTLNCPVDAQPIDRTPVDLGFGPSSPPLWQAPVYTPEQQQADAPVPPPSGPEYPGNLDDVLKALAGQPDSAKADAEFAYYFWGLHRDPILVTIYDPAKVTLAILARWKTNPRTKDKPVKGNLNDDTNPLQESDLRDCLFRPGMISYGYFTAQGLLNDRDHHFTDAQQEAMAQQAGETFADTFPSSSNRISPWTAVHNIVAVEEKAAH
jgi:type IV secretory pathway VirB10-like protein